MRKNVVVQKKSFRARKKLTRKPKLTETEKRERRRIFWNVFFWIFGFFVFSLCVYLFLFSPFAQVRHISIETSANSVSEERIREGVYAHLNSHWFFVFSRSNFFVFSSEVLKRDLENRFITLSHIEVKKIFPHTVRISFDERKLVVERCGPKRCLGLDGEGYAFVATEALGRSQSLGRIPILKQEWAQEGVLRSVVTDQDSIQKCLEWDDFARSRLGDTQSPMVIENPEHFEEYRVVTEKGWEIRVSTKETLEEVLQSLALFLETVPEERKEKIQNIDLRIEGKVFFTEKPEESAPAEDGEQETLNQKAKSKEESDKKDE